MRRHVAYAVDNPVAGLFHHKAPVTAYDFDKRRCRRVNDYLSDRQVTGKRFNGGIMFFVRALPLLFAPVVVVFTYAIPFAITAPPQFSRRRVKRTIVALYHVIGVRAFNSRHNMLILIKHRVNKSFGSYPFTAYVSIIENA